ncbi:MAG: hypothetical protein J7574_04825 [Flavobacterium sp.]|uniref:hypothetical protein n=1 Tax=Flavobacterium sp. TaxID=239 RepID=UPI001B03505F|nr:hypothetical protein [Flavobacterium sp.]MBO9583464.1 hypothetical protein [Flavobacterium sp.]
MRSFKLIIAVGIIFLSSCNFNANVNFKDEREEKNNAESTAALFYSAISSNKIETAIELFSDSLYKNSVEKEKLKLFLIQKKEKVGDFKDYNLKEWKTARAIGTDSRREYLLIYNVKYDRLETIETIILVNEKGKVKIWNYNVDLKEQ